MRIDAKRETVAIRVIDGIIVCQESVSDEINLIQAVWQGVFLDQDFAVVCPLIQPSLRRKVEHMTCHEKADRAQMWRDVVAIDVFVSIAINIVAV